MTKINSKFQYRGTLTTTKPNQRVPQRANQQQQPDEYEHLPEDIQQLVRIHTFKRRHGSASVDYFVEQFIACDPRAYMIRGSAGENLAVVISTSDTSRTMFSSHVDTVHRTAGRQKVVYDHEMGLMLKTQATGTADNECLGADDGAGIWVMLQMIKADVPGTYVFHYGEEVGGIGSSGIASECEMWLAGFDRAIAIDRKGTDSVITHQGWGRCCSDTFAKALSAQINMAGQGHSFKPDTGGVFTDTANYVDNIPECTNLSCGYDAQHTAHESLDVEFLIRLKDAMLVVDWEALPTERVAGADEPLYEPMYEPMYGSKSRYYDSMAWDYGSGVSPKNQRVEKKKKLDLDDVIAMTTKQIRAYVAGNSVDDVTEMMVDAADHIAMLEDEVQALKDAAHERYFRYEDEDEDEDKITKGVGQW